MTTPRKPIPVVLQERGLPRLDPRTPPLSRAWPGHVIVIDVARRYGTGGPAILGRYLYRSPQKWARVEGWFSGRDGAPPGFTAPPGTGALIPLREKRQGQLGHFGFLEDVLMKMGYRGPRAVIAGWPLGGIIGSLSANASPGGKDGGSLSHVIWTFVAGIHAGVEDRNRPRIEVRPLEGHASLFSFTGRATQDAQDYVPPPGREREQRRKRDAKQLTEAGWQHYRGRFCDLQALAYTTTGNDRLTLPQACALFGITLAADHAIATPENLLSRMAAIELLYDAIIADLS